MRVPAAATICSVLLLSVVAQTAPAAPPNEASLKEALDRVVGAGVPGAVLLVRDGNRTIRLASGYSVVDGRVRARPGDRFRIGSVTKSFVVGRRPPARRRGEAEARRHGRARLRRACCAAATGSPCASSCSRRAVCHDYLADPRIFRPYLKGNVRYAWTPSRLLAIANAHKPNFAPARSGSTRTRTTSCSV